MKINLNSVAVPAVGGLVTGAGLGTAVAGATGRDLHIYMRFVGLLVLVALAVVGTWAYRRFFRPEAPVVEEVPDGR